MTNQLIEVSVASLGSSGDGIVESAEGRIFVPYAAPGDSLRVRLPEKKSSPVRAEIVERLNDGPHRHEPLCTHFTVCGGCAVQHVDVETYSTWKRSLVTKALSHRGIDPEIVGNLVPGGAGRRRRARFHARSITRGAIVGYRAARSHRIVPISECPVLVPAIVDILEPLTTLLGDFLSRGQEAEIAVTLCDTGLDICIAAGKSLALLQRNNLIAFAELNNLVRLSWQSVHRGKSGAIETVIRRRAPTITYANVSVEIPADAFVQATAEGEAALREIVLSSVAGAGKVVDLYAGCGAFSLPLAAQGFHVLAVDSASEQMLALESAARGAMLGEFTKTERRDLDRRPLMAAELNAFGAAILDPPRAGAMIQAQQLAEASLPTIVYVSCNPASFARDARIILKGGYGLDSVLPVDQFLFSTHVELVGVFRKIQ
jgi:23S rRNA (uracil1939-C5)-methyltransferase